MAVPRLAWIGSSPRVRGTHQKLQHNYFQMRFIPARAGNTSGPWTRGRKTSVHPRACGEHNGDGLIQHFGTGSSPRVRGTPLHHLQAKPELRFIPARAGNTSWTLRSGLELPVHPRACGEHVSVPSVALKLPGSSPRVRGTPLHHLQAKPELRFIPARAGNTSWTLRSGLELPVHPRACGEHVSVPSVALKLPGSSPRVRGTPLHHLQAKPELRFIPARAGNTMPMARRLV